MACISFFVCRWSKIASHLPGRTDNEIKNFWNTHIRKKLLHMGIDPETHKPRTDLNPLINLAPLLATISSNMSPWGNNNPLPSHSQLDITTQLSRIQLLQNLLQILNANPFLLPNNQAHNNHTLLNNPLIQQLEALNTIHNNNNNSDNGQPLMLRGQEYANPYHVPKSWTDNGEGGSGSGGFGFNNDNNNNTSYHQIQNQSEMVLPALVSASPATNGGGALNQTDGSCITGQVSTNQSPDSSTIFEAWEKLLDDEASGSEWKEILEYVLFLVHFLPLSFCLDGQKIKEMQERK